MQPLTPTTCPISDLPVRYSDRLGLSSAPYVMVAMHTPQYAAKADRLLASCVEQGVAIALYEVPTVHNSMSGQGTGDPSFTKPAFIRAALERFNKPVLYVDSDTVVHERPQRFARLAGKIDLAVYNLMADPWNDFWRPVPVQSPTEDVDPTRFWAFYHAVDFHDDSQLLCVGMTQFWGYSPAAFALLADWQTTITTHPCVADDECLDLSFNTRDNNGLRWEWLGKAYARLPSWPHVRPVISHPDPVTQGGHTPIDEVIHRLRFDATRASRATPPPDAFPRDAILDTHEGIMYRLEGHQLVKIGMIKAGFWV